MLSPLGLVPKLVIWVSEAAAAGLAPRSTAAATSGSTAAASSALRCLFTTVVLSGKGDRALPRGGALTLFDVETFRQHLRNESCARASAFPAPTWRVRKQRNLWAPPTTKIFVKVSLSAPR